MPGDAQSHGPSQIRGPGETPTWCQHPQLPWLLAQLSTRLLPKLHLFCTQSRSGLRTPGPALGAHRGPLQTGPPGTPLRLQGQPRAPRARGPGVTAWLPPLPRASHATLTPALLPTPAWLRLLPSRPTPLKGPVCDTPPRPLREAPGCSSCHRVCARGGERPGLWVVRRCVWGRVHLGWR